jgi:hypothetical protein
MGCIGPWCRQNSRAFRCISLRRAPPGCRPASCWSHSQWAGLPRVSLVRACGDNERPALECHAPDLHGQLLAISAQRDRHDHVTGREVRHRERVYRMRRKVDAHQFAADATGLILRHLAAPDDRERAPSPPMHGIHGGVDLDLEPADIHGADGEPTLSINRVRRASLSGSVVGKAGVRGHADGTPWCLR